MRTLEEVQLEIDKLLEEKKQIKNAKKEKLEKEKETRRLEVEEAYNKYIGLRGQYICDYGKDPIDFFSNDTKYLNIKDFFLDNF